MKLWVATMWACLFLGGSLNGASDAADAVVSDVKQTDVDMSRLAKETKEDFLRRTEAARSRLEARITRLKKRSENMEGLGRTEADRKWANLKRLKDGFDRRMNQLTAETGDKWVRLRSGVDHALEDLENAYEDLAKGIK